MDGVFVRDGLRFEVFKQGPRNGDAVVLLHGFPQDAGCWGAIAEGLCGEGYRVLAPNQRGYSPEARPGSPRAYLRDELVADVLALADAEEAERFHLVGHDWGAVLAWDVAALHAARVRSLTALSVPHPAAYLRALPTSLQLLRSVYILGFVTPGAQYPLAWRGGAALERLLRVAGLDRAHAARYARRLGAPEALRGALNWYRALLLPGARRNLPPVAVRTLFLWGTRDPVIAPRAAALTADYVHAPYRPEPLEGAGHWLPERHPERVLPPLLAHLAAPLPPPGSVPADGGGEAAGEHP